MLGVSLQVLANWRVRQSGPVFQPVGSFKGNKTYYRLDDLLSWLASRQRVATPAWTFSAAYLKRFFVGLEPQSRDETEAIVADVVRQRILTQPVVGRTLARLR